MIDRKITLEILHVPNPCTQDWATMGGNDQVRFCSVCEKNVYNLSAMTRHAAESLVAQFEGPMCARFYKRDDGTVVTADCSAIRKSARRAQRSMAALLAGVVTFLTGITIMQPGCTHVVAGGLQPPPSTQPLPPATPH
jgi:hypothetical protein